MKKVMIAASVLSCSFFSSCQENTIPESAVDAYGDAKLHLVIAAKPSSKMQGLWICKGTSVAPQFPQNGYEISIGVGIQNKGKNDSIDRYTRSQNESNLTPVGKFHIGEMIGQTCAPGMTERCMQLVGEEPWNQSAVSRGIYIHGTTPAGENNIGESASHGCVRMTRKDVVSVYNYTLKNATGERIDGVNTGTKVYITNNEIPMGENPCARTDLYRDTEPPTSWDNEPLSNLATAETLESGYLHLKLAQLGELSATEKCLIPAGKNISYEKISQKGKFHEIKITSISDNSCSSWIGKTAYIFEENFKIQYK